MELHEQLKTIGLSSSEISVYLLLLEEGLLTPPQIAKGTGIARPHVYPALQSLEVQRLVSIHNTGKRKMYAANDPESLFQSLEDKRRRVQQLLPDLRALYASSTNKPTVHFYDGFEQIKEIYYQTLHAQKVYGIGSTKQLSDIDPHFYERWLLEVQKKNIVFYDILSHASGETAAPKMKQILRGLYDSKLLPATYSDTPTDILIWDDTIALITLQEPIFGTVLKNPLLAKTFTVLFNVLWQRL